MHQKLSSVLQSLSEIPQHNFMSVKIKQKLKSLVKVCYYEKEIGEKDIVHPVVKDIAKAWLLHYECSWRCLVRTLGGVL